MSYLVAVGSQEATTGAAAVWDIARPAGPPGLPGVTMAGFSARTSAPVDLQVVPHPAVTVVVDVGRGDALYAVDEAAGRREQGTLVAGLAPHGVRGGGRDVECLQIRLSPIVAYAVLGEAAPLEGTVVCLEDIWGRDAVRTQEQLIEAKTWEARFALAADALGRRVADGREVDDEVRHAWRQITSRRGQVRVDEVAHEVGWGRKRLWSRFRAQVGINPKRAAQLVRFDHAAHRLASGDRAAWAAAEAGYADQSHLHREAVAFTGLTPTALASAPWLSVDDVAWADPPG